MRGAAGQGPTVTRLTRAGWHQGGGPTVTRLTRLTRLTRGGAARGRRGGRGAVDDATRETEGEERGPNEI